MLIAFQELEITSAFDIRKGHEQGAVVVDGSLAHLRKRVHRIIDVAVAQDKGAEVALQRLHAVVDVRWLQPMVLEAQEDCCCLHCRCD